jgi:hypothetical protein
MAITKLPRSGIADNSINASKIEDGTVAIAEVSGTISNAKLANSTIANAKLSNSTITVRGTSRALGTSFSIGVDVDWQSIVVSDGSTVTTMAAGKGYFVNNTSAAGIVKLPAAASIGDTIAIKDYAGNFGTNNLTIQRNSHKIQGNTNDSKISTNRASIVLVYVDATKGWLYTDEHNVSNLGLFTAATGGTVATVGDYKIHAFTGDGNFVVSSVGPGVDYLVVAGGGGGGADRAGGGGAGGFRMASGLPVGVQTYPITVGGGGAAGTYPGSTPGAVGSNSVFSTITSAGGGTGAQGGAVGGNGGSGGGGGGSPPSAPGSAGGAGNTPPVSPSQGNNGGTGSNANSPTSTDTRGSGGGGGASAVGGNAVTGSYPGSGSGGDGGAGSSAAPIFGSNPQPFYGPTNGVYAGGGGGGTRVGTNTGGDGGTGGGGDGGDPNAPTAGAGTANTGGGGGGAEGGPTYDGAAGGKGIVLIRYKFQ